MKSRICRAAYWRKFSKNRKLPYLVTFVADGEPCARLMSMQEIANLDGFSDCNNYKSISVYLLSAGSVPEPLSVWKYHQRLTVELRDMSGNFVDSAEYDDH